MSSADDNPALGASLLDRLLDDDPGAEQDPHQTPRRRLRDMQLALRRDLQELLNTRERCLSGPAGLTELESSVFSYGLPDLSTANLEDDDDQEELLERIEQTIRTHEPRFENVEVTQVSSSTPGDRTLRFKISARIHAAPYPEELVFDSSVEPLQRKVEVRPE